MASLQQAIDAFRAFPWNEQLAEANQLQICSPTLFLKNSGNGSVFFASLMLAPKLEFMLFLETEEETEGWTLFGKRPKKKRVIYDSYGHNSEEAEEAIRAFYADDRSKLKQIIIDQEHA